MGAVAMYLARLELPTTWRAGPWPRTLPLPRAASRCRPGSPSLQGKGHSRVRRREGRGQALIPESRQLPRWIPTLPGRGAASAWLEFRIFDPCSFPVPPAGFEPALAGPSDRCLCLWATRARAATQCRTEPPAVRRRGRKPCAAACISIQLPGLDSNQRGQGPEPCWGRQRPTRNRVRETGSEPARAFRPTGVWARHVCIPSLPLSAPPGSRTPHPKIKSLVL